MRNLNYYYEGFTDKLKEVWKEMVLLNFGCDILIYYGYLFMCYYCLSFLFSWSSFFSPLFETS